MQLFVIDVFCSHAVFSLRKCVPEDTCNVQYTSVTVCVWLV